MIRTLSLLLLGLLMAAPVLAPRDAAAAEELILRVGESKTIYLGRIKNVQVGDPSIIEVQTLKNKPDYIAVFGLKEGYSSLIVGDLPYDVTVVGDIERLRKDVETLLLDIPGIDVLTAGDRVVVDGVVKRRDDWDRIQNLVESNKNKVFSLALLDERDIVRKAQLQLHFQVLEVNRNLSHDIGINWTGSGPVRLVMDTISYVQFGPGFTASPGRDPLTGLDEGTITRTPDDLLKFDSTTDVRRVLDKDFFTTISGEEVEFFRGKELIFINEGFNGQIVVKQVGLIVKATPVIDDDGDIDLGIEIVFSTVGEEQFGNIPAINIQKHVTHVQLREGESFALSGFFRREKGRVLQGLPGMKDIPGLGVLFGTRAWSKGETDGIIVLTPVLVDPERRSMKKQIKETLDIYDSADVKW